MPKQPIVSGRRERRRQSLAAQVAYVIVCGGMIVGLAALTASGFMLPPPPAPMAEAPPEGVPYAKIQLYSDRGEDVCRHIVFHNDTGRFDEGGFARCRGLIPDAMLVESAVSTRRTDAIARAFKFR
jgi:hypothetical protein